MKESERFAEYSMIPRIAERTKPMTLSRHKHGDLKRKPKQA